MEHLARILKTWRTDKFEESETLLHEKLLKHCEKKTSVGRQVYSVLIFYILSFSFFCSTFTREIVPVVGLSSLFYKEQFKSADWHKYTIRYFVRGIIWI